MSKYVASLDPDDTDNFFFIFCDVDGTNTGADFDNGRLNGETISSVVITATNVTVNSDNTNAVTLSDPDGNHVSYDANTVVTVNLSAAIAPQATVKAVVTTSTSRVLTQTMTIPVKEH